MTQDLWRKIKYSLYATLLFLLVTNPMTYTFTQSIFQGVFTVVKNGIPTSAGYFLHAALFFLLSLSIMMLPRI